MGAVVMHINVTERKMAETALRESEQRLSKLFHASPAAICVNTVETGRVLDVNEQLARFIGFAREELVGRTVLELKLWADPEMRAPLMARLQAEGSVRNVEAQFRRKDGSVRDVLVSCELVQLPTELAPVTISMFVDVTERKHAEASLRESEERLRLALDAAHLGTFDWDVPHNRITWSRWHEELWGFQPGEFAGTYEAFAGRVHPDDLPEINAEVARCIAGREPFIREFRVVWPDGSVHWIAGRGEFTLDAGGQPMRMRGAVMEITQRKQAEVSLRESEARFRATFEQVAVGVARLTPEGRWLEVNQRLCDIVGYPREELLTKTFQDITHPDDLETDLGFVRQLLAGEIQTYALEKRYWRKDGSLVWINLTVSLVREPAGTPLYFISVIEDIHARKQAEAALRQLNAELEQRVAERTAELEEANHELDSFSHSVSHDLRAPLRAISGFGQFLGEECASTLDERGRGLLRHMMEAAARMSTLIDDLLQFAHASRSELRRRPVDLSALAQEVVGDLQQAAPERRVQFLCAPGLSVSGDARLLRVVLVNLLGNAWKYTGKAAEPRVEFGRLNGDDETSFFIRDNGAGFDMRYVDRLFGAFQRLHSMAEFEGTGVGLATVQRIVHRHGGKIWAEAKVNEGATFYLTLPTRKEVNL